MNAFQHPLFIALALAAPVLLGCTVETPIDPKLESLIDRSFITGQPCAAPCWYGLEAGKSTEEEVRERLGQLPFVVPDSINVRNDSSGRWLEWDCVYDRKSCGAAGISDGRLVDLRIDFAYELYMEQAVSRLGSPDEIGIMPVAPAGGGRVILVWRQKEIGVVWIDNYDRTLYDHLAAGKKFPRGVKPDYAYYGSIIGPKCSWEGKCIPWPGFE